MIQTVFKILTSNDLSRIILVSKVKKSWLFQARTQTFERGRVGGAGVRI